MLTLTKNYASMHVANKSSIPKLFIYIDRGSTLSIWLVYLLEEWFVYFGKLFWLDVPSYLGSEEKTQTRLYFIDRLGIIVRCDLRINNRYRCQLGRYVTDCCKYGCTGAAVWGWIEKDPNRQDDKSTGPVVFAAQRLEFGGCHQQ